IIKSKNDPILLGTNGVFTMCFLITMLIAAAGFIVFWVLSIKDRSLKFGIFRAMGMPMRSVTLIMICEQLLVSGVAIATGILLGSAASKLFIPLLQLVHSSSQLVPPFRIIAYSSDYIKVISVTGVMLVSAIAFLYWLVRKINIHQVLKLGED
ncbi:MAG: ABC transporter permease, partial [Clostridiaceae bacterium]|nr:ABC transporter permease [Clostridiaceae bacterium]